LYSCGAFPLPQDLGDEQVRRFDINAWLDHAGRDIHDMSRIVVNVTTESVVPFGFTLNVEELITLVRYEVRHRVWELMGLGLG
jgi:hypothetical protein